MLRLGDPIVYAVPDRHLAVTKKRDDSEIHGSIHHHELIEFAGQVTRLYPDGRADIIIFPPFRLYVHLEKLAEGDGPGQIRSPGMPGLPRVRALEPDPPGHSPPEPAVPAHRMPARARDAGEALDTGVPVTRPMSSLVFDDEELGTS